MPVPVSGAGGRERYYKTRLCHQWMQAGSCIRGADCNYAHGQQDLRGPGGGPGFDAPPPGGGGGPPPGFQPGFGGGGGGPGRPPMAAVGASVTPGTFAESANLGRTGGNVVYVCYDGVQP